MYIYIYTQCVVWHMTFNSIWQSFPGIVMLTTGITAEAARRSGAPASVVEEDSQEVAWGLVQMSVDSDGSHNKLFWNVLETKKYRESPKITLFEMYLLLSLTFLQDVCQICQDSPISSNMIASGRPVGSWRPLFTITAFAPSKLERCLGDSISLGPVAAGQEISLSIIISTISYVLNVCIL